MCCLGRTPQTAESSGTNLTERRFCCGVTVQADSSFEFEDPAAAKHQSRFYRVVEAK